MMLRAAHEEMKELQEGDKRKEEREVEESKRRMGEGGNGLIWIQRAGALFCRKI